MTDALSYHGNPQLKRDAMARATRHVAADMLQHARYWRGGKGCSVGCHAHDLGLDEGDHGALAAALGWPEWLVRLQDVVFEGLSQTRAARWHMEIVEAVPVGVDLAPARHRILRRLLLEVGWRAQQSPGAPDPHGVIAAVDRVADLHDQCVERGDPRWVAAAVAADTAARAAADAAVVVDAADAEARAVAADAAAAAVAAEVAEVAAADAADGAVDAPARSAARSAAWDQIADIAIEEIAARQNFIGSC